MRKKILRRIFPLGALLLFSSVAFSTTSNIYTFPGPDVDLGQDYVNRAVSGEHYLGGRGDTIYVLRQSVNTYCHKSTDGGRTFGPGVQVNSIPGAVNASLHVDTSGVVYVAYQADEDIYFTKSIDAGQTFTPGVKVNDDTISQTAQERPVIAVNDKGQIFIAWRDQRDLPQPNPYIWTLFSSASFNGGASFIPNVRISGSSSLLLGGYDIGADDFGRVYVVWEPYTGTNKKPILLARSDDSGLTFYVRSVVTDLPSDISTAGGFSPSLAVESNVVGVAWEDYRFGQYSLRFSNSSDFGQSFSPSVVVDSSGSPQYPSLIWKNGVFYVAWRATHRLTPTGPSWDHMWFSYSPNGGKSFVPYVDAVPDDTNFVGHISPTVWVSENEEAFVAWIDFRWSPYTVTDWDLFVSAGHPGLSKGDLDFDGVITMQDILLELNAIFFGQSFPAPFERADGNCDGKLTPADMVILLNRWYWDVPFPCG